MVSTSSQPVLIYARNSNATIQKMVMENAKTSLIENRNCNFDQLNGWGDSQCLLMVANDIYANLTHYFPNDYLFVEVGINRAKTVTWDTGKCKFYYTFDIGLLNFNVVSL